jgi:hypothetical protein
MPSSTFLHREVFYPVVFVMISVNFSRHKSLEICKAYIPALCLVLLRRSSATA